MPLLAYLWKVGAALLLLLFVADYCVPRGQIPEQVPADRPAIRIHSDRKWPERIVLDARSPTIVSAAPAVKIPDVAMSSGVTEPPVNRIDNPTVANALAMLPRPDARPPESIDRKRQHKTSNVAARPRRHVKPQMLLVARQGQFGWFGFRTW
ncbi:hypothetical protein BKD09_35965 [Bradyrhizobium japonicum]|uniref:Uncharacterized protein n=2 Tax=Bradyrhizobium TaxID=374 RepID=A0A939MJQ0_9BRAD|nr:MULTISPECIES: hypothetical protein [Bradyrhizobium]APG13767.1 hypothetical protein BKD09_35965 [Bradyrhizobium japonicum]UEM10820.1 hypothetical protein J4G43_040345 [Bradyrhizobium barranii subsp. barranii]